MLSSGIQTQILVLRDSFPSLDKCEKSENDSGQLVIKLAIVKSVLASSPFIDSGLNSQQ